MNSLRFSNAQRHRVCKCQTNLFVYLFYRVASNRFNERSSKQDFEFEVPPAMTIEEFAAKQEKKKNKNSN
jgi:hypothetical protein